MNHTLKRTLSAQSGIVGHAFFLYQDGTCAGRLFGDGWVTLYPGFEHDGATMVLDTPQNLDPSRFHDFLYLAIERDLLPASARRQADIMFCRLMVPKTPRGIGDCVLWIPRLFRAGYHYLGVRLFGGAFIQGK